MDNDFQNALLGVIEDLTEALNKKGPAPEVNVEVPAGAPPKIEVVVPESVAAAPEVTVEAPQVTVEGHKPCGCTVEVTERDSQNFIRKLKITPTT